MGVTVCSRSGGAVAATLVVVFVVDDVVDNVVVVVADGVMVSPLFPATDIGMTASSNAMFVVIGAIALRVGTKTAGQLCCQGCNNDSNAMAMRRLLVTQPCADDNNAAAMRRPLNCRHQDNNNNGHQWQWSMAATAMASCPCHQQ